MALNLKGRLEKLEATVPVSSMNYCTVIHRPGVDCNQTKAAAIATYIEENGHEPTPDQMIHIHLISPETKRSGCACKEGAEA